MTRDQIQAVLESVGSWPPEDQEELAEIARDIAARRLGLYRAADDELEAIREAETGGEATAEEVEAAFRAFRPA